MHRLNIFYRLLCVIGLLVGASGMHAITIGNETMVNLTLADGLAGETVYRVITDHSGGTWIATSGGLNIFNGRQLHEFPLIGDEGQPLEAYDLCEIADSKMYVATDAGLYCIEKGGSQAKHVLPEAKQPISLMAVGDTLYIGSEQGLMVYDGRRLIHHDVDVSHQGLNNIVRQYGVCEKGRIWFLGRFDLNCYDPKTEKITRFKLPEPVCHQPLTQFTCLGQKRFLVGTRGSGLFLCDLNSQTAERIGDGIGNIISTVRRSADGNICVATDGTGAFLLDGKTLEVKEHFHTEGDALHRLPYNGTYCYYRDVNGVNWFGFVRYGLVYTYYTGSLFDVFKAGAFISEGINVRTYCRHDDDVILGTQNGFYYVNTTTGAHRFFSSEDLGGGHIVNTVEWYAGRFYIGTFDGGLSEFDTKTMTIQKQSFTPELDNTSIGIVKVGPDGRLWIGSGHGLFIIDDAKVHQHFTEQNSRIVGGLILSVTFDGNGNAWLTGAQGCSLYSVRSNEIVETTFPKGFFNKQPWMQGAAGHDGLVFFRTGPKTFYTNDKMTDFGELKLPVSFTDKWCRSFVDDMKGHYLLASERGLFSFNYELSAMIHLGGAEGLRGNFINDMGLEDDSLLWVATSQGLYFTTYKKYQSWKQHILHNAQLVNIRVGSDLLSQTEEYLANESHNIRLSWNMTSEVLQAEVLLPDYSKYEGRLYEYRVCDEEWQIVDDGQPISVRGLMLGVHPLEIRLAGSEATTSVYTITVIPSVWAVLELVLLVLAITLLWVWWRFRKNTKVLLSERDEIEDALVEMEQELQKEEEKDVAKYERVKIDEDECADIVKRMKEYIEREKFYTNADLKMKDLADVLHLSAPKLSQIFNIYLGQNYYDYINRYRLDEFKRLIAAGEYKRYTITALSEQCGFKKSNFFSTFRKVEGITPTEYLKKIGIKL